MIWRSGQWVKWAFCFVLNVLVEDGFLCFMFFGKNISERKYNNDEIAPLSANKPNI